jgi:hypothetical protein
MIWRGGRIVLPAGSELLATLAQIPDESKQEAIDQVTLVARLTTPSGDSRGKGWAVSHRLGTAEL